MSSSTTLTVRLRPKLKNELGKLAKRARRTKSFLAGEAIADYIAREREIIAGIKRGLADMHAGRLVPHEEAMARMRAAIKAAEHKKRDSAKP